MVRTCYAIGCTARDLPATRALGLKFYRFPQNKERRAKSTLALRRKDFAPNDHSTICSQHFVGGRLNNQFTKVLIVFSGAKSGDRLSPAYVPSIFSFTSSPRKRSICASVARFDRAKSGQKRHSIAPRRRQEYDDDWDSTAGVAEQGSKTTTSAQTDVSFMEVVERDISPLEIVSEMGRGHPAEEQMREDDSVVRHFTSLPSLALFQIILNLALPVLRKAPHKKMSSFNALLACMMKLHLACSNYDLGFRFVVHESTIGRLFRKWIDILRVRLSFLVLWPDRELLQKTMPLSVQRHYGKKVVAIIDCFELFIETPRNSLKKSCTWSQYKHHNKAKYLISIALQGVVTFISKGWGGRVSDKHIVENSGFLKNLLPGDVLADRGFTVADSVASYGAVLNILPFTRGREQLSPKR